MSLNTHLVRTFNVSNNSNRTKYFCHYHHSILMNHQQLIDTIMDNDKNIRFAAICNMVGDIEVTGQSDGIEKFLSAEETKENLENAAKIWLHAGKTISKKIGKGLYTSTAYEKLKRVTVPLEDGFLLFATMDNTGEENQTMGGILKLVHEEHA